MNAKDLLIKGLKEMGADGLYISSGPNESCGCGLDDFVPCDGKCMDEE